MDQSTLEETVLHMRAIGNDLQDVEVKAAAGGMPASVVESISAFANGSGGVIILGLSEREGFAAADGFNARAMFDALSLLCSEKLTPPVRADISIERFEGFDVVVAEIPEMLPNSKPCYVMARGMYKGSFIRTGDGDHLLSSYEIDRMVEERVQPQHDLEIVEGASHDDLDPDLVAGMLARQRRIHPRVFGRLSDSEALAALNVTSKLPDGATGITLAGLLALGSYPQHFYPRLTVQFACYPGLEKNSITSVKYLDSETMAGPIPAVLVDTIAAVRRNTRVSGVMANGLRRDVADYPENAVREAVCNALMHRDYSSMGRGSAVQVDLYPDRLEVLSPGGLYGSVTVDMLGEIGASSTRNQHLSNLLETTPYEEGGFVAENRGTGFSLIKAELAAAGMPEPEITDRPSLFRIVIRRRGSDAVKHSSGYVSRLAGSTREVLDALSECDGLKTGELIEKTGFSRATVVKALNTLMKSGLVEASGPSSKHSPNRIYRVVEPR